MNILLPKFLSQTLRQRPQPKFPSCKCASSNIAPQTRRSACKNQRPSSSIYRINSVILECLDRISRKGKRSLHIDIQAFSDLFRCDIEERFPDLLTSVP